MVASIKAHVETAPGIDVALFLLMQRCTPERSQELRESLPDWVRLQSIETQISLSKARNRMLAADMAGADIDDNDIVGFPDDDCWYPDGTLKTIHQAFDSDQNLDFWFCRYSSQPQSASGANPVSPQLQAVISRASSNTIFLRGRVAKAIGGFDEELGVGARLAGGEDTDYAIRAFQQARKSLFLDIAAIGHRDPDKRFRAKYYPGALRAISKNTRARMADLQALTRKLLVGVLLILRGQMPAKTYLFALANMLTSRTGS
jgi:hypothetical protein